MSARPPLDGNTDPRRAMTPDALDDAQTNGYPIVASQFARRDRAGLTMGGSIAILLGAATLFAMSTNRTHPTTPVPAAPAVSQPLPPAPMVQPTTPPPLPAAAPPPAPPIAPAALPRPAGDAAMQATAALDRARSPALVFDNSPTAGATTATIPAAPATTAKAPPPTLTADEQFAQRFGNDGESASATRMVNPSTTIGQGTLMSAILETAIDSDLPGYVRAVISRDVKSYDGSRVLIPRGSHVIGEYKSGLAVGQTRAFVLWTRLLRPDGVSVALGSPATDTSGRNGLGGKVSSHFGKRFGAAILLSVIGAAGQAIGGGSTAVVIAGPQQAVSSTAQQNLNIPPTVRVALGQPIRIFTARDLDFSTVSDGK